MIPKRYENASYDDVPEDIKVLVRDMAKTGRGIYLYGGVGSGKTHIAYAIKKQWDKLMRSRGSQFWNTTELFREIKDDFDRNTYDKKRVVEKLMDSDCLLFLDDIGSEKPTDFVQETFYLFVNKKYNDMKPIVFTSNYSLAELSARIGDRTVSRIVEMCAVKSLNGKDKRLPS